MKALLIVTYKVDHQCNHLRNLQTFVKHLDQRTFSLELVSLSHFKLKVLHLFKVLVHHLYWENNCSTHWVCQLIHFTCLFQALWALK